MPASASASGWRAAPARCNGEMDARLVRRHVRLEEAAERALAQAYAVGALSARGRHRVVRVAQTIADLDGHDRITHADVLTALSLRQRGAAERDAGGMNDAARAMRVSARTWLLGRLGGPSDRARARIDEVLVLGDDDLIAALGGREQARLRREFDAVDLDGVRLRVRAAGLEAICGCDPAYPPALRALAAPPAVLHVAGGLGDSRLARSRWRSSARGGRRRTGWRWRAALGRGLAVSGVTVVSGMALGIDSAAHAGALEAGGPTVAVLPGSADVPYPPGKRALHRRILAGGRSRVRARARARACGGGCSWRATGSSRRWRR